MRTYISSIGIILSNTLKCIHAIPWMVSFLNPHKHNAVNIIGKIYDNDHLNNTIVKCGQKSCASNLEFTNF